MRLLLDEMIGPQVAGALRLGGVDAVGVVESPDLRGLPDRAVLEHALVDDRVVVTRNVSDFAPLARQWHAEGRRHAGLVLVTEQAFPQNRNLVGALVRAILQTARTEGLPGPGEAVYLRPAADDAT